MRGGTGLCAVLVALVWSALPAQAQDVRQLGVPSPILTLDQDRLFSQSLWGQRTAKAVEEASFALAAENRQIEAEFEAEERELTEQRPNMSDEEFRARADAFDARVVEVRLERDTKERELAQLRDLERQRFFNAALPVLAEVLQNRGAVAILDNRSIFIAADAIDVTDELIARLDATIGAGTPAIGAGTPAVIQPDAPPVPPQEPAD